MGTNEEGNGLVSDLMGADTNSTNGYEIIRVSHVVIVSFLIKPAFQGEVLNRRLVC
ncbi:hypothetical protein C7382_104123 [Porphyromonas loveana]|uniref:Uncharacterized protein n=1 Tax=Porphyromonas loveana TaxID=1884669 RepID=A0A2U1FL16_9PORP|nr:hypothetical protein C7382_104123 [Porphyromonas loveana]